VTNPFVGVKGLFRSVAWLTKNYVGLVRQLKTENGISRLAPYACNRWHRGSKYFMARDRAGEEIFIKIDGDNRQLKNEASAWSRLKEFTKEPARFVPIRTVSLRSRFRYAVFDRVNGALLSRQAGPFKEADINFLASELLQILNDLESASLIHRDITPENLLIHGDRMNDKRVLLIDFAFSLGINDEQSDSGIPIHDLRDLCYGFKPDEFTWDDAYSCDAILRAFAKEKDLRACETVEKIRGRIGKIRYSREQESKK